MVQLPHGQNDFDYGVRRTQNASLGAGSPRDFHLGDFGRRLTGVNLDLSRELAIPGLARPATLAWGPEAREDGFVTGAGDAASYKLGPVDAPAGAQAGPGLQAGDATRRTRRALGAYGELSAD